MSDLISLKITIENQENYLLFGDRICRDVKDLDAFCKSRYQDLQKNVDEFRYFWIDDDGDEIRVTTDEDYRTFLQAMANAKARLYVDEKKTMLVETDKAESVVQAEVDDAPMQNDATGGVDSSLSRPLHQHVICDVCDKEIVGHRYKCLSCHDYDLCMTCESKFRHKDHLMLRIPKPSLVCRSHSVVSRMFDKLRMYSARITSIAEKDAAVPEPEVGVPGHEAIDANGMKRANAGSKHRSKHSEERRANTETSKTSRAGKLSGCADRKQNCAATETSGERPSKETKVKPSTIPTPTLLEMTQRYREAMLMYLNTIEDPTGKPVPWSTTDHVAVANAAAAAAAAAAARATAAANKAMQVNLALNGDKVTPVKEPSTQELEQMLRHANAQKPQKTATTAPPPVSITPIPMLPFLNLAWPSQEKLMVASENVSKLLDPLGLSFEIRRKSSPSTTPGVSPKAHGDNGNVAVPSTSATVTDASSVLPTEMNTKDRNEIQEKKQDKIIQATKPQQVVVTESSSTSQMQTNPTVVVPSVEPKQIAEAEKSNSDGKEEQKNLSSSLIESDSVGVDKPEVENEADDEEDSQNTSSASLLTDDDQDLLEVAEEDEEKPSSSAKSPKAAEKTWTLIDIPHDHDEEKIANVPLDAIAKLIGHDISSTDKEEPFRPKPLLPGKEMKKDKAAEEKAKESEPSTSVAMKSLLTRPNSGPSSSSSSASASTSTSAGRSGKSSRKSSSAQKDFTIYSHRPHVNHAIHTMMTMGFSNHNGWLTQLLESLNGDIPKALDLLLQHRH